MSHGNVKLDVADASTFLCSGSITLGTAITAVTLSGLGNSSATGTEAANTLTGNKGETRGTARAGRTCWPAALATTRGTAARELTAKPAGQWPMPSSSMPATVRMS
jgi:hypothetical protein